MAGGRDTDQSDGRTRSPRISRKIDPEAGEMSRDNARRKSNYSYARASRRGPGYLQARIEARKKLEEIRAHAAE